MNPGRTNSVPVAFGASAFAPPSSLPSPSVGPPVRCFCVFGAAARARWSGGFEVYAHGASRTIVN